ncbi:putative ABC transporter ATP-binding protein [bioreactor metagenome]|uniref:Putative ABC transporter ATP-binding protein n=1 Tax=bioreactor metagenome TaxID=1076179 RepID=A0A645G6A3_9ZZZZ
MRFYDVDAGSIVLDNNDIRHYSRRALRGSMGMVLQDTWLFNGTIKENIRYGRKEATDQDIIEAAEAAHAHHFISTLPGGYDFVLNEDGTNISQGQRQLITIARAIVSQPKILILDEATSSVDTRTEMMIQDAMNKMMVNRTSFIIAHRLSTIKNAKTIIVMNKGQIVEAGNHKELLEKGGFYADLYNAQFSGSNPMAKPELVIDTKGQ